MSVDTTEQHVVTKRAFRMAYAPLRSAQHALDLVSRMGKGELCADACRKLAEEESRRIDNAIASMAYTDGERETVANTPDLAGQDLLVEQMAAAIFETIPPGMDVSPSWAEWVAYAEAHPTHQRRVDLVRRQARAAFDRVVPA